MIDFHVHQPTTVGGWGLPTLSAADYLEVMDAAAVDVSVVFTIDGLIDPTLPSNDAVHEYVASAPERMIGFGNFAPRAAGAPEEAERCFGELGFAGLKFHPWAQAFAPQEPFMDAICEVAAAHDAPILFHDGTPPYSTPMQIAALARRNPATKIVLGHGGLHDMWRESAAAVRENENVFICMCGLPPYAMRLIVETCPLERILFGTDGGIGRLPQQPYVAARIRQFRSVPMSDAQRAAIEDENPRRLLKLAAA